MKQEGKTVRSTRDSAYDFKGKVLGNRLKGKVVGAVGYYYPLEMEMPSNKMSFTGTLDWDTSNTIFFKGKRIRITLICSCFYFLFFINALIRNCRYLL